MISTNRQVQTAPKYKNPPAKNSIQGAAACFMEKAASLRLPIKITHINLIGDRAKPSGVEWVVKPEGATRIESLSRIERDLSVEAGFDVRVVNTPDGVVLRHIVAGYVATDYNALVSAVKEHAKTGLPIMGLGFMANGRPALADISKPSAVHGGVFSQTQSGKTNLCQVMLSTLCEGSSPRRVGVCIIDHKNNTVFASHIGNHVIGHAVNPTQWTEALRRIRAIMDERKMNLEQEETWQHIVVFCDELGEVIKDGGIEIADQFASIARRGAGLKVHMLVATQRPDAAEIAALVRANITLRIAGKVNSPAESVLAAGLGGVGAEKISKPGQFIIVKGNHGQHVDIFTPLMLSEARHPIGNTIFASGAVRPVADTPVASVSVEDVLPDTSGVSDDGDTKLADLVSRVTYVLTASSDAAHLADNEIFRRCKLTTASGKPIDRVAGGSLHRRWTKALEIARSAIDNIRRDQ